MRPRMGFAEDLSRLPAAPCPAGRIGIITPRDLEGRRPDRVDQQDLHGPYCRFTADSSIVESGEHGLAEPHRVGPHALASKEQGHEVGMGKQNAAGVGQDAFHAGAPSAAGGNRDIDEHRVHQRVDQSRLVGHVAVESVWGHAEVGGNAPHRDGVQAVTPQDRQSRRNDVLATQACTFSG